MSFALDRPGGTDLLATWSPQPVALALVGVLAAAYVIGLRRVGHPWPVGRQMLFWLGLALLVWTSSGVLEVYADDLYWAWTTQTLLLWLVVPILVLGGHPVQLARAVSGPGGRLDRVLRSRFVAVVSNPLVGPALVPLLSAVLFFGPLPGWTIRWAVVGWLFQLTLLAVGAAMVLPLVGLDEKAGSLAVGLSLLIGSFELVLDALPGVILRLHTGLVTSWFDHRAEHVWSPSALHDQQIAGAILWAVAEVIDLPFLVLVYRRWLRADARDAAQVDAVLEAERAARRGLLDSDRGPEERDEDEAPPTGDVPWWLTDPAMRDRMRRRE